MVWTVEKVNILGIIDLASIYLLYAYYVTLLLNSKLVFAANLTTENGTKSQINRITKFTLY